MKDCIKKYLDFYKKDNYDNLIKLIVILLNTLNLFFLIESKYCVPITILLLLIYYKISKKNKLDKDTTILTWITFSIFTLLGESYIISTNSGTSLNYNNSDIYNVSSWLFSAYASMVLSIILIHDYYKFMLN